MTSKETKKKLKALKGITLEELIKQGKVDEFYAMSDDPPKPPKEKVTESRE